MQVVSDSLTLRERTMNHANTPRPGAKLDGLLSGTVIAIVLAIGCAVVSVGFDPAASAQKQAPTQAATLATQVVAL